jgi:Leucine-rich repeat (LRR) protein
MSIKLKDYLFNSSTALVLHGIRELVDADLAKLRDFSEEQRTAITSVVLSNTHITGECFRYLEFLPNLRALYANKTQVTDNAPFECLPKRLEIINLEHSEIGDVCAAKLRIAPNLRSVRAEYTGITSRGVNILATIPNLRDCHVDDKSIPEHTRRRLNNVMVLRSASFNRIVCFLLYFLQLKASKYLFRVLNLRSAWRFRIPFSMLFRSSY